MTFDFWVGVSDVILDSPWPSRGQISKILSEPCSTAHYLRVDTWETKSWPEAWTTSLIIPLPKKGNLKMCQNHRTISLISHPSKIMLRIILNRLKNKSEELLAEEQAGFRPRRSTAEQIFNIRVLIQKHLHHQQELHHNFIDFKKAFDRVWHEGLWHSLRKFNFDEGLISVISSLYDQAQSAVLLEGNIGEKFHTSVGVRQGCLLSPVLFNLFLETIMLDALEDYEPTVSINGRKICNLRFADDIDLIGKNEVELQDLTTRLEKSASRYGMEISNEKSKIRVNGPGNDKINMYNETLEQVTSFKYLGSVISADGTSGKEIQSRINATSCMGRLKTLWKSKNITLKT